MNALYALVILSGGTVLNPAPAAVPLMENLSFSDCAQAKFAWIIAHPRPGQGMPVCVVMYQNRVL